MTKPSVQEFGVGGSKTRQGLVVGAFCAVAGLGIAFFAPDSVPDRSWLGGLILALGAGVALHAWRTARRAGPQLRIDQTGIYFREWGVTAPWDEIEDVYQTGSRLQPFITLRVKDSARFLAALSREQSRALGGNRLWRKPELRIPFGAVEASRDEILDAVRSGLDRYA